MEYSSNAMEFKMKPWVHKRCKLSSPSQIYTSSVSSHYCLFVFIAFKSQWDTHTMLGKRALYLLLSFTHTDINTRRHAPWRLMRNQSSRGVTVYISVNTSNCLPARELASVNPAWQSLLSGVWLKERGVLSAPLVSPASARTTSMACAEFVLQLIGLRKATHSKNWSEFIIYGNREIWSPKTADIETNSSSSVQDKEYSEPF